MTGPDEPQSDGPPGQPFVSPDDLASIQGLWDAQVQQMLPVVAQIYKDSAGRIQAGLISASDLPDLPGASSLNAETYLASVQNVYQNVGNDLFATAQTQLTEGFKKGESIDQLAGRLRASAGLTARNANLVARSTVIEASNAGSIQTARASGLDMRKQWIETHDARTRPTHRAEPEGVGGQIVDLQAKFTVGGFPADAPGDPLLPAAEKYRCRCTLGYIFDDEDRAAGHEQAHQEQQQAELPGTAPAPPDASLTDEQIIEQSNLPAPAGVDRHLHNTQQAARRRAAQARILAASPRPTNPEDLARWKQAQAQVGADVGTALAHLDELSANGASERAIKARMRALGLQLHPDVEAQLTRAGTSGDRAQVQAALDDVAQRYGLVRVGPAAGEHGIGNPEAFEDGQGHRIAAGTSIQVIRPAYTMTVDSERVTAVRGVAERVPGVPVAVHVPAVVMHSPGPAAVGSDVAAAVPYHLPTYHGQRKITGLDEYVGSDYETINGALREGKPLAGDVKRQVADIDKAMKASKIKRDIETYRATNGADVFGPERLQGDLTGASFGDEGFVSTSIDKGAAEQFSHGIKNPILMTIRTPTGTRAVYVAAEEEPGVIDLEKEVLLDRGLTYRVVADHQVGPDGIRRLEVEVVPKTPPKKAAGTPAAPTKTAAEIATEERRAKRAAARETSRAIEAAKPYAELGAHVNQATGSANLQWSEELGKSLTQQADYAESRGVPAAELVRLRAAIARKDAISVLGAAQDLTADHGLTQIGLHGSEVEFDIARMESVSADAKIADNDLVRVLRPGYDLALPNGDRLPALTKAIVKPVSTGPATKHSFASAMKSLVPDEHGELPDDEAYEAAVQGIGKAFEGRFGTLRTGRIDAHPSTSGDFGIDVYGEIMNADGNTIGSFYRKVHPPIDGNPGWVSHELLTLQRAQQGSGFAAKFNAQMFEQYRQAGLSYVTTHANIDVGGYTWASQGFDFSSAKDAMEFNVKASEKLNEWSVSDVQSISPPGTTTAQAQVLLEQFRGLLIQQAGGTPISAFDLSQFGRPAGSTEPSDLWLGKAIMLGLDWQGSMPL